MSRYATAVIVLFAIIACVTPVAASAIAPPPPAAAAGDRGRAKSAAAAKQPAKQQRQQPLAPRSLLQACRGETRRLCARDGAMTRCLSEKIDAIEDAQCKAWVVARDACAKAVAQNPKCGPAAVGGEGRRCLRTLPAGELPELCVGSDYYKSILVVPAQ